MSLQRENDIMQFADKLIVTLVICHGIIWASVIIINL